MTRSLSLKTLLLFFCSICLFGCSDNADDTNDPIDTVMLNMMNEENGKTLLAASDVFINKSDNFQTSSCYIADAGANSGIGVKREELINNLAQEVAVTPGHLYQVFDKATLREFPSKKRALKRDAAYYKVYVVSSIAVNQTVKGSAVKYVLAYPNAEGLPENGYSIGDLEQKGDEISYALPKGAECVFEAHSGGAEEGSFSVKTDNGKLTIALLESPNIFYGPYGTYNIYIRLGTVYAAVQATVGKDR